MTRLPLTPAGAVKRFMPDVYSVLLLIAVLFMLAAIVFVTMELTKTYGLSVGDLIQSPPKLPT
jgi:hypothetical protein